jgi:hypothetical protein
VLALWRLCRYRIYNAGRCRMAATVTTMKWLRRSSKNRGPIVSSKSRKPGKSGNLSVPVMLLPVLKLLWNRTLNDEIPPRLAVDRAWTIYLAAHANVDAADHRRCTLERYLRDRWNAGENDPEELTCLGLSFLWRLERDNW